MDKGQERDKEGDRESVRGLKYPHSNTPLRVGPTCRRYHLDRTVISSGALKSCLNVWQEKYHYITLTPCALMTNKEVDLARNRKLKKVVSTVKNNYFSYRGPGFSSQHTHDNSQTPITPGLGHLVLLLTFVGTRHVCSAHK